MSSKMLVVKRFQGSECAADARRALRAIGTHLGDDCIVSSLGAFGEWDLGRGIVAPIDLMVSELTAHGLAKTAKGGVIRPTTESEIVVELLFTGELVDIE